jgi:hypothetical protein
MQDSINLQVILEDKTNEDEVNWDTSYEGWVGRTGQHNHCHRSERTRDRAACGDSEGLRGIWRWLKRRNPTSSAASNMHRVRAEPNESRQCSRRM